MLIVGKVKRCFIHANEEQSNLIFINFDLNRAYQILRKIKYKIRFKNIYYNELKKSI